MRNFSDLASFTVHLAGLGVAFHEAIDGELRKIAEKVEKDAKAEFGHYQPAVGPFPAWAPLADSTLNGLGRYPGKIALGYAPPDNPLLREGDLRESIGHNVDGLTAVVGSSDERMIYHEQGTARMPARPVLGPAGFRNRDAILKLIGAAAAAGLIGAKEAEAVARGLAA